MTTDGVLIGIADHEALCFERRLASPPERVWRAVSAPDEMAAWFPCAVEGERRVGATVRFRFEGQSDAEAEIGEVASWSPPTSWSFRWGGHLVEIEVHADGDGSRLVFRQHLPDRSGAARQGAGWHVCLDALGAHLDGGAPAGDDWTPLYRSYLERMSAPMATVARTSSLTWERTHHESAARVWRCLTDGSEVSAWWGHPIEIDARVGGRIHFDFRPHADPFDGVVVICDEGRRIAWTFGDVAIIDWTVEPIEHGTRFRLTQHHADAGDAAGWHGILEQLDMYLASGQLVRDEGEAARRPAYEQLLRE